MNQRIRGEARQNVISALIIQSIISFKYEFAFQTSLSFQEEIMLYKYFPVFDRLLILFRTETALYEIKIAIINNLLPIMTKDHVEKLFKYI